MSKLTMIAQKIIKSQSISSLAHFLLQPIINVLSAGPIPTHIVFIMDGNRRFAKKRNLPLLEGHKAGYATLLPLIIYCCELGIKFITVYAFSIENFKRKPEEVQSLMDLMLEKIEALIRNDSIIHRYGIRLQFIGDLILLTDKVREAAQNAMKVTAKNDKAALLVCVAYTSTNEMAHAVDVSCREKMVDFDGAEKHVIRLSDVEKNMLMGVAPDPDILIRSSGETRLSNFLTWQTSNSLIYSPAALWPELGLQHLIWGVLSYQRSFAYLEKSKKQL